MHEHHFLKPNENHPKPSDSVVKSEEITTPLDMTMILGRRQGVIISTEDEYYRLVSLGHPEFDENDFFTRTINSFAITYPRGIIEKRNLSR